MSLTRDNLVSDWRASLAAAEAVPVGESPRARWLVRVRTRLYRFLLSLYGDGSWRADGEERPDIQPTGIVFDTDDAKALAGKPAKDIGKIRTVLKAVANNQDHRLAAGTLTGAEVAHHNSWLIVTSGRSSLSLPRCQEFLAERGIECRMVAYGTDWALEVPADVHPKAWRLLEEHRTKLRKPRRVVQSFVQTREQPAPRFQVLAVLFAIPLVWFAVMALLTVAVPDPQQADAQRQAGITAALGACAICCVALVWAWFRTRRRPSPQN